MCNRYAIPWYVGVVCWYMLSSTLLYSALNQKVSTERLINVENSRTVLEGVKTVLGHKKGDMSYTMPEGQTVSGITSLVFKLYTESYNKIENEYTWRSLFGDGNVDPTDTDLWEPSVFHGDFLRVYKDYCSIHQEKIKAYLKNTPHAYLDNKTLEEWLSQEIIKESTKTFNKRCYRKFKVFLPLNQEGFATLKETLKRESKNLVTKRNMLQKLVSAYGRDTFGFFKKKDFLDPVLEADLKKSLKEKGELIPETGEQSMFEDWLEKWLGQDQVILEKGVQTTLSPEEKALFAQLCLDKMDDKSSEKYLRIKTRVDQIISKHTSGSPSLIPSSVSDDNLVEEEVLTTNPAYVTFTQFVKETEVAATTQKENNSTQADKGESDTVDNDEPPYRVLPLVNIPDEKTWWQQCSLLHKGLMLGGGVIAIGLGTSILLVKKTAWGKRLWEQLCGQEKRPFLDTTLEKIVEDIMALYRQAGLTFEDRKEQQEKLIEKLSPEELSLVQEEVKKRLFDSRWYDYGFFLYEQDSTNRR